MSEKRDVTRVYDSLLLMHIKSRMRFARLPVRHAVVARVRLERILFLTALGAMS